MLKKDDTIKLLSAEITNFKSRKIPIVGGYSFNQKETVEKAILYLNNQYKSGQFNSKGQKKWFFPLHEHRASVVDKNIDLDLKDINIISQKRGDYYRAWLAQNILYNFLKQKNFSKKLNDIVQQFSRMGNIVAKKDFHGDDIFKLVDPRKLIIVNQAAETLDDTAVIIEHDYTQADLREMMGSWDTDRVRYALNHCASGKNIEEMENFADQIEPNYKIYERYGEVPESYIKKNGSRDKYVMAQTITCLGDNDSVVLHQAEWKDDKPFKECHFGAYKGRWWREGVVELLFELQERYNEVNNQMAWSMELGSKQLYMTQSLDQLINSAVTDLDNGDIVHGDLARVDNTERELNAWNTERQFIERMADLICSSQEVITGESLPSGTPFKLGTLMDQNASKLFDFLREKMGIFIREIMEDWVAPKLLKEFKKEHFVKIINKPEYLEYFFEEKARQRVNREIIKGASKGYIITANEAEQLRERYKETLRRDAEPMEKVSKGMFDNFQYDFDVTITGEAANQTRQLESGTNLLQMVASNPQIVEHPQIAPILNRVTELAGFNPADWQSIAPKRQPQQQMQQQAQQQMQQTQQQPQQQQAEVPNNF